MHSTLPALDFPLVAAFAKTQDAALAELIDISERTVSFGESLSAYKPEQLNHRSAAGKWSALECLEHLNRYADHYLPLLQAKAVLAKVGTQMAYRPGLLGKFFALSLHPARRQKAISSPGNMNPLGSALDASTVLDAFRQNQLAYLHLLQGLRGKDLRGNRIPVSAFPIVKLSFGDMLHTLVWHNARHVLQAEEGINFKF